MKKYSLFIYAAIVALFVVLESCTKAADSTVSPNGDKGDTGATGPAVANGPAGAAGPAGANGPAGAAGPAGPTGPAGANGATGAQGPAGTANVTYGGWVKMDLPGYWYKNTSINSTTNSWGGNFAAPISQAILDKGAVMVYARYANNPSRVFLLPTSVILTNNGASVTTEIFIQLNRVYIENVWTFATAPTTYVPSLYLSEFRYVIIPGAINGRKANIDYADYNAVKAAYNMPD